MQIGKTHIIVFVMSLIIAALCLQLHNAKVASDIAYSEGYKDGTYVVVKSDETIKQLKKENRALYDSIKSYKEQVTFLAQFKYQKVYKTDTIYVHDVTPSQIDSVKTYTYSNGKNDSINYVLDVGSISEPNWYKLKISIHDNFIIINRNELGLNNTTIHSDNNGIIEDVTIFNKKRDSWKDRFKFGPQIGVGYGTFHKKFDTYIGFGITYGL